VRDEQFGVNAVRENAVGNPRSVANGALAVTDATLHRRNKMNFDPTTQTGKVYRCTACPETFDTPQKLGTHVSQSHRNGPRPRQIRVRNATAKKGFMLEVIVRTHASPS